jgi:hypothetical protein
MFSMRHHLVTLDWRRFSPTNAVNRCHHGLWRYPRASEINTNVPAIPRMM